MSQHYEEEFQHSFYFLLTHNSNMIFIIHLCSQDLIAHRYAICMINLYLRQLQLNVKSDKLSLSNFGQYNGFPITK